MYKQTLKPIWMCRIQLWGCASKSNVDVIQRFQNKVLSIVDAPRFSRNADVHRDLEVEFVATKSGRFTSGGYLIIYKLHVGNEQKGLYQLVDSPQPNLRRDSAELFIKEVIPSLQLTLEDEVAVGGGILSMVCIRDELMLATTRGHVVRYRWDGTENRDYCLDLRRIPFCIDQQVAKAVPIVENNTYIIDMEYSPLIGGFAIVLNDGRAAFLTSSNLMFDPNQVQGIWAQNIDDATCCTVNHKYRLITFGRKNSQAAVYEIDEVSGGLELTHEMVVSAQVYPGQVGAVACLRWTPDGCAVAMAWTSGGFSLWSTFGSLLVCSLAWDYGLHVELASHNPINVTAMEWSSEGYQLWMVKKGGCGDNYVHNSNANNNNNCNSQNNSNSNINRNLNEDSLIQLGFVKSALTVNPCMSHQAHLYLQGEDRIYVNLGAGLTKVYQIKDPTDSPSPQPAVSTSLVESKAWIVILIPSTYSATNWPIKYTAIDREGCRVAVAGRSGLAHYSLLTRKWKLFGNETQEKDMVVTGGLLWWHHHIVAGCYNLPDNQDEIRIYASDTRLSNQHMTSTQVSSQLLLLDSVRDRLLVFCADSFITIYVMSHVTNSAAEHSIGLSRLQIINIGALRVHPACVVSVTLQTEPGHHPSPAAIHSKDSFLINVSGRLLSVHQHNNNQSQVLAAPTVLASCVENVWVPSQFSRSKPHLTEALWLFCGAHGMRVWLPLYPPREGHKGHTFMSKRVMLPFQLNIYPLAILFEDAILLGAENDTVLYSSDSSSPFSLPFCTLERTSQVYLHQILRQLIRRNLGYHAWEIARCCTGLPYFSHSLELLLHEVLEEEATSKEPIPDAQLPSVVEFIQEFPVYLETVVQCARKTEIALWPYLFAAAGKPKHLFQECLARKQLDTAASYLIILQNLESSSVSRQFATMLLDSTLENGKWELSKDLVRFLKAIDPNDVESPRTSFIMPSKYGMMPQSPPVAPNEEDLSLVLGSMQVSRGRSFSTTVNPKIQSVDAPQSGSATAHHIDISTQRRKKSVPTGKSDNREWSVSSSAGGAGGGSDSAEEFFMDVMIQRHARRLLTEHQLSDLGRMSAHLLLPLVGWLARERQRAARLDARAFVTALRHLHADFAWPYPQLINNTSGSSLRSSPTMPMDEVAGSRVGDSVYMSQEPHPLFPLPLQPAVAGSRVGDSGYMSQEPHPLFPLPMQPAAGDERSIISENESWFCDNEMDAVSNDTSWTDIPSIHLIEQVNLHISQYNKGSHKSEVQLRYLLQIFLEAGCLEWSLLIAVLLQDAMAVHRTTTIAARSPDQTYEAINRLKEGIIALIQWSATECYGYKPFMMVIQSQVVMLNRLLATKQRSTTPPASDPPHPHPHPPPRSRTSSDGGGGGTASHSATPTEQQSAESADETPPPPQPAHSNQLTQQSNCTVS
ncbi:guanine nucleotide exchange factor subunit Rich [Nilaparvata lugens]|uniref:guanine nucleotide exchange factor subunit Rich n=1 Tax=Nilaparvata lugens TaxID=108931 RepID=UPI00193E13CD|nr:guanine nucleotide exchange factor subunit Rich [Nilaparvata lugens]